MIASKLFKNRYISRVISLAGDKGIRQLGKGAVVSFIIRFISIILVFLVQIAISRNFGVEVYGIFSYSVSLCLLLSFFLGLGFNSSVVRFVSEYIHENDWASCKGLLSFIFIITAVLFISGSICLVFLSFSGHISSLMSKSLLFSAFILVPVGIGSIRNAVFQAFKHIKLSLILRQVLIPAGTLALVFLSVSKKTFLTNYVVLEAVLFILSLFWLYFSIPDTIKKSIPNFYPYKWLFVSLPMLLGTSLQLTLSRVDVIMLGGLKGITEVSLYSAANRISLLIIFTLTSVHVIASPMLASAWISDRKAFKKIYLLSCLISFIGAVPLFVISFFFPAFILSFFGQEFNTASQCLKILAIGNLFNSLCGPCALAAVMSGNEKSYAVSSLIFALINIVLNYYMIMQWGITGAALATVISLILYKVSLIILLFVSFSKDKRNINQ